MFNSDKISKLNPEILERISGGSWTYNTLTEEEQTELEGYLERAMHVDTVEEAMVFLGPFYDRMDAKYGAD